MNISFSWIATDSGGLSSAIQTTNILVTGTLTSLVLIDIVKTVEESTLDDATEEDLEGFVVNSDGNITYSTTYTHDILSNEQFIKVINKVDTAIEKSILGLLPSLDESDVSVTFDTNIENQVTVSINIQNVPNNPLLDVLQNANLENLILNTINLTLPLENSIFIGDIKETNSIVDLENTVFQILESTTTLQLKTTSQTLISLFDMASDVISNPNTIIETLKDLISTQTLDTPSVSEKTINIPSSITTLMIESGLLYIKIEEDGTYQIFSPLFNILNSNETIELIIFLK